MFGDREETRLSGRKYNVPVKRSLYVDAVYTIDDVNELRDKTPIGSEIEFVVDDFEMSEEKGRNKIRKTIKGVVTGKFPQVLVLDGKYTYTWKDYLLGKTE